MLMRRDVAVYGGDVFFFYCIHVADGDDRVKVTDLEAAELRFVVQFRSHDERYGYNV